jgi:hypothetical protein
VNNECVDETTPNVSRSSTHSLFTEAVATAVAPARFVPATLQGRLVRQVVQQPFSFVLPGGKGKN